MSLPVTCPCCGESWQVLSPGEMDEAAGQPLDHQLNGSAVFYTRAEVLALMERVKDACENQCDAKCDENCENNIYVNVDVARLLDSDVDPEAAWTKGNIP